MTTTVTKAEAPVSPAKAEKEAAVTTATTEAQADERTQVQKLRDVANAHLEDAAKLVTKANEKNALADNLEAVFSVEVGSVVTTKRRNGDVVEGTFQGAKDTGRGVLVAVQIGTGFDAEQLKVPLSNVTFGQQADPLAGVDTAE